jgi:hypothetical protein
LFSVSVSFSYFGIPGSSDFANVRWINLGNLVGPNVDIPIAASESSIEVCYDYSFNGTACCSGTDVCYTLSKPPGPLIPCGITNPCTPIINEVFGKNGDSFIELLITGGPEACEKGCDLRSVILDDNNGGLIKDPFPYDSEYSGNINRGYLKFSNDKQWQNVPLGTMIVIYENSKSNLVPHDANDANGDDVYTIWAENDEYLEGYTSNGSSSIEHYQYNGFPTLPKWSFIDVGKGYDGVQVRHGKDNLSHAISMGYNEIGQISGSQTVPLEYMGSSASNLSVKLIGSDFLSSADFSLTLSNSTSATPGVANSSVNGNFINGLLNCGSKVEGINNTELKSDKQVSFTISPNPVANNGTMSVISSAMGSGNLIVRTIEGRVIAQQQYSFSSGLTRVALPKIIESLSSGLYLVDFQVEQQSVGVQKLVVLK